MTDTIEPSTGSDADAPPEAPGTSGSWRHGTFVRDGDEGGSARPTAEAVEPQRSRILPIALLVVGTAAVLRWFGPWGVVIVVGLGVSIVLHEFGHYLAARQAGMKVTEFFVGFGPRIWSKQRGEVEYGVKPVPLGAYVRIVGMNDLEEVDPADEGRTYREKGYWARLRVVLAGPFMNFAIGFVLLVVLFACFPVATNSDWKVDQAQAQSAALVAGLRHGDLLVSIDGRPVSTFDSFGKVIQRRAGEPVTIVVRRDGHPVTIHATVGWVLTDKAVTDLAPVEVGDRITKVGTTATASYAAVRQALATAPKGQTSIELVRNGNAYRTKVATPVSLPSSGSQGFLGITAAPRFARQGPIEAVRTAGRQFTGLITGSVQAIGRFFSPSGLTRWTKYVVTDQGASTSSTSAAQLVPIHPHTPAAVSNAPLSASAPENNRVLSIFGLLRLGSQAGGVGLAMVISVLALINVFLGLINLMPLPPFDGGHAAVATYEVVREKLSGRPYRADMAKLIPVTYAVLALMVFVFLSSSYLDLFHPAANPFKSP